MHILLLKKQVKKKCKIKNEIIKTVFHSFGGYTRTDACNLSPCSLGVVDELFIETVSICDVIEGNSAKSWSLGICDG